MSSMMRVETSLTGFTEWLIISAGTVAARNPAAICRSAASTNSVACSAATGTSNRQASAAKSCRARMRRPCSNRSGCSTAPPVMSSGLCGVPKLGSAARSSPTVASVSAGSGTPSTCARSATISQAPPEIDTKPSPRGSSTPVRVMTSAVNSRSSIESTRTMPSCRHTPSNTRSSPTSAPVCACAERAVISDSPIFSTTIGLPAAIARRAADAKLGASRIVSANSAMARTSG